MPQAQAQWPVHRSTPLPATTHPPTPRRREGGVLAATPCNVSRGSRWHVPTRSPGESLWLRKRKRHQTPGLAPGLARPLSAAARSAPRPASSALASAAGVGSDVGKRAVVAHVALLPACHQSGRCISRQHSPWPTSVLKRQARRRCPPDYGPYCAHPPGRRMHRQVAPASAYPALPTYIHWRVRRRCPPEYGPYCARTLGRRIGRRGVGLPGALRGLAPPDQD